MCCPSATGVGVAQEFFPSFRSVSCFSTGTSHRILPFPRSKQITWHEAPPSIADVRKTRSPHTTGDDHPPPGPTACHATCSVSLQRVGGFCSVEIPCPVGPRN